MMSMDTRLASNGLGISGSAGQRQLHAEAVRPQA